MINNELLDNRKRFPHLDILRLVAIYLVMFNHTGEQGYMLFAKEPKEPISALYMAFSVFCKIAVPLFFMISGALLLKKDESLMHLFRKRLLRIAIVLVMISVPYYYFFQRVNGVGIIGFLKTIYSNSAATLLWYLYSYMALLLMLPFLRSMVKNMQEKDFIYLIVGYVLFTGVLPCLEYLMWKGEITLHPSFSPVLFMTQNLFFALIGYYFEYVFDIALCNRKSVWIGGVSSIAAIAFTCFMTYWLIRTEVTGKPQHLEKFFECFICIPAATVYCVIKRLSGRIKSKIVCRWISVLGSAVFGVYLIEKLLRMVTKPLYGMVSPHLGSFAGALVWCFATICLGLTVIVVIKHIPFINKIVNKFI